MTTPFTYYSDPTKKNYNDYLVEIRLILLIHAGAGLNNIPQPYTVIQV